MMGKLNGCNLVLACGMAAALRFDAHFHYHERWILIAGAARTTGGRSYA
jgi:hypothetical protein